MSMKLRPVKMLLIASLLMSLAPASHAGFGDKLKKKLGDVGNKEADKASGEADKATGGKETSSGGSAAKDSEPATGNAGKGTFGSVSTRFDFVPGDSVMFLDDFTRDELGEFPSRWKLASGTFEVAEMDGERWLRCVSDDGHIRMKVPPGLPEFWTLEFDGNRLDAAGNTLTVTGLSATGSTAWEAIFPYSGHNLAFRSGDVFSDTPFEAGPAGRHHFMFMARGPALKVYIDRDRLASVPDVTEKGVAVEIDIRLWSTNKPMIANVRLAEGCRPAKDALDDGKLVTYGILFASGSDVVLPESAPILRQVAAWMEKHPDAKLKVTGHTDNVGSAASNLDLSKRRASSVAKALAEQFAVAADRFTTDGKGDTQALASNAKPEGRAMNRRVEFAKP
jgi:outer membrane protein OmpA-like peptidoglycan-associated protein